MAEPGGVWQAAARCQVQNANNAACTGSPAILACCHPSRGMEDLQLSGLQEVGFAVGHTDCVLTAVSCCCVVWAGSWAIHPFSQNMLTPRQACSAGCHTKPTACLVWNSGQGEGQEEKIQGVGCCRYRPAERAAGSAATTLEDRFCYPATPHWVLRAAAF